LDEPQLAKLRKFILRRFPGHIVDKFKRVLAGKPPAKPKEVVDSALSEKFEILDKLIEGGYEAEAAAAAEVKSVYESGGTPTEAQLKRLRNMLYRSSMRNEANHFRVASRKSASVKE